MGDSRASVSDVQPSGQGEMLHGSKHFSYPSLLHEKHNCWRIESATRLSFLIDGDAYFRTLREAAVAAQRPYERFPRALRSLLSTVFGSARPAH